MNLQGDLHDRGPNSHIVAVRRMSARFVGGTIYDQYLIDKFTAMTQMQLFMVSTNVLEVAK